MGYVPAEAPALTLSVKMELPEPGAGIVCELKLAVTPEGIPDADRLIAPLNPPLIVAVTVDVPALPCGMVRAVGKADMVKLACPLNTG
jgi:hypothetical protein